jgi:phage gp36-like protein
MAYSAQADIQNAVGGAKRLGQLTDWTGAGTIDAAVVVDAIAEADAIIDSYAGKRFSVPFSPVPEVIKRTSAEMARIILARRREMISDDLQARWVEIAGPEGWLHQLATGVVTPGGDPLPLAHSTMAADRVDTTLPDERDASRANLTGFW